MTAEIDKKLEALADKRSGEVKYLSHALLRARAALYQIRTYGGPRVCSECDGEDESHASGCFTVTFSSKAVAALADTELLKALG